LELIEAYLFNKNIPYNNINDEAPVSKKLLGNKVPRKVYANVYIDDRSGMTQVYEDLLRLLKETQHEN